MDQCVLLNADYTFLNMVDWKRAMRLIAKDKVQVLRQSERIIRTAEGMVLKVPLVMKLIKLIRKLYLNRVPFSKKNVLVRDGFKCAYCGNNSHKLTIDHIIPKSRNGKTSFENCVASCKPCNNTKGGRTPSEAGMYLRIKPFQPTISEFLRLKVKKLGINHVLKSLGIY
jgi:5-methylcytosine-specific restriction endonuclease McrA